MNTFDNNGATKAASAARTLQSRGRHRRFFALGGLLVLLAVVMLIALAPRNAAAQRGNPPNQPRRGLVYDGLTRSTRAECRGGFDVRLDKGKQRLCTHGPDPVPPALEGTLSVPALETGAAAAVTCDGDGVSGSRFQLLYVRAADMPDRFADYAASIQQWARDADELLNTSANETGGTRHFRFVHDASCVPIVQNVVVTAAGDDTFSSIIVELYNQGFNRADRDYVILADASTYCGIATITADDDPSAWNSHNTGPYYSRIDARCWSGPSIAHEMMHNLGGVQMSAPHTTNNWHCTDEYDLMCYQDSGTEVMQYLCDVSQAGLFDCNHDDYFNTNPAPGSYLATHWNTANNIFLMNSGATLDPTAVPTPVPTLAPTPVPTAVSASIKVDTLTTGKANRNNQFVSSTTFKLGDTVWVKGHIRNQSGANLPGVSLSLQVSSPEGANRCSFNLASDANGNFSATCPVAARAPTGQWKVKLSNLSKSGYVADTAGITERDFTVTK